MARVIRACVVMGCRVARNHALRLACVLACCGGAGAHNNVLPSNAAVLFDHFQARDEVEAGSGAHPTDALTCTRYADFTILETGTDGPGPGPAFAVPQAAGQARAPCVARTGERGQKLETAGMSLIGRKGPFLFFDVTDGQNSEGFTILRLPDGHAVYSDKYQATGDKNFKSVSLDGALLHLVFARGYDGSCSLLKDGAACWSKMIKEGHFSRAVASQPPPTAACAAAYRASSTPASDPNTITYDVDMTLMVDGKVTVLHRGALGCQPEG